MKKIQISYDMRSEYPLTKKKFMDILDKNLVNWNNLTKLMFDSDLLYFEFYEEKE